MRNECIVCGAPLFMEPLINCNRMPDKAQHFPSEQETEQDKPIMLRLRQCSGCGLVQLDLEPVPYYRDVIRSGGYSTTMHYLRHEQYQRFMELCPIQGKKIIEVGCGQGEFLRIWREDHFHVDIFGVENDETLVTIAQADGLKVKRAFAQDENTELSDGPFDGFCSFNFIEHQPNPNGMLRCIYRNLKDEAYGLITVPAWEYIVEQECYYELIHDHIAYYNKDSFQFLLEKNGFVVLSIRMVNRDTWEAIVSKRQRLNAIAMENNKQTLKQELDNLLAYLKRNNKKLALWGASHQGLTILSSMSIEKDIAYVIDSAPFKQGLLTIGTHLPIVAPDHIINDPVQAILIVAPGYTDEIAGLIQKDYGTAIEIYALRSNHLERVGLI